MAKKGAPGRETYSVRLRPIVIDTLRHLSVDRHTSLSELLEEAITDVLAKYDRTIPVDKGEKRAKK
ncbi:MAG: ribbon-helix-helix domain-containing protein [Syntrophorhabdales bacterium]|jgi:hypothetical protein